MHIAVNKTDISIYVIASQLSAHYEVISYRLWHHQQNVNREKWNNVYVLYKLDLWYIPKQKKRAVFHYNIHPILI